MFLDLTSDQEALLQRIAEQEGKTPAQLLLDTLAALVEDEEERKIIEERITEADRGEFLSEEEMHTRFLRMLHPR